jgi:hypothetical protein
MSRETSGQTLQPTALVHEAWLRLSGSEGARFENRAHFFGAAAEAILQRVQKESTPERSAKPNVRVVLNWFEEFREKK